jgi:type II secretory pathway pseudopilin PulG
MNKSSQGFTLLEILVASTILFSSIAVVSLIFKTSYVASEKATLNVEQAGVIKALLTSIQLTIREDANQSINSLTGNGVIWGVPYQWQAELIANKAPPNKFDADTGNVESYSARYKLWNVALTTGKNNKRKFEYNELSWY